MTTTFQQRHYEAIADMLYYLDNEQPITKEELVNKFVNLFAGDNYKFKESIFRNWCVNYHGKKEYE